MWLGTLSLISVFRSRFRLVKGNCSGGMGDGGCLWWGGVRLLEALFYFAEDGCHGIMELAEV